ncbi:MAG TPA: L,D-transpeptidase family protein [Nocardioides sp.]|jgi:peptidoglycan hydrolase-like protein with peptidoglycan-binding domain|nr:L,D-transpeptidase family protein [Nocardioides sp.]
MKVFKTLLTVVLVVGFLGTAAYAGGSLIRHHDQRQVSATDGDPGAAPAGPTSTPADPTGDPSADPSGPAGPSSSPTRPRTHQAADVLRPGTKGTEVRELQQRLFQLAWLPETTTGVYDDATVAAVKGFQAKRGLRTTGVLDRRTWHRLVAMTEQPTHDAMFNVLHPGKALYAAGDRGSDVRAVQARLKQIDWYFGDVTGTYDSPTVSAVKGFQAKRQIPVTGEVDQRTLDRLDAMTTTPTHAEMHNREPSPGALDARCLHGRVLCIDKTSSTLRWVVDGHVQQTLDARFGSTLNDTPTREGVFHVYLKDADHVSHLYGSSMPYAMFFSGGQAVHYSSDFAAVGYNGASHGCVNIRDYDGIKWLFSQVRVGDKVVVYWS